jgi:hypothetical protein
MKKKNQPTARNKILNGQKKMLHVSGIPYH